MQEGGEQRRGSCFASALTSDRVWRRVKKKKRADLPSDSFTHSESEGREGRGEDFPSCKNRKSIIFESEVCSFISHQLLFEIKVKPNCDSKNEPKPLPSPKKQLLKTHSHCSNSTPNNRGLPLASVSYNPLGTAALRHKFRKLKLLELDFFHNP